MKQIGKAGSQWRRSGERTSPPTIWHLVVRTVRRNAASITAPLITPAQIRPAQCPRLARKPKPRGNLLRDHSDLDVRKVSGGGPFALTSKVASSMNRKTRRIVITVQTTNLYRDLGHEWTAIPRTEGLES